jgi:predicted unusual protein kinase regulating ubiquinone biosynthesis (AarF/ABC1/UbiB family)
VQYDPERASSKFFAQPFTWLKRNVEIFVPIIFFSLSVIWDIIEKKEEQHRAKRAEELLNIIGSQSPALIKAGQALSSRPDLLPKVLQGFAEDLW